MEGESEREVSCDLESKLAASFQNSMAGSSSNDCPTFLRRTAAISGSRLPLATL